MPKLVLNLLSVKLTASGKRDYGVFAGEWRVILSKITQTDGAFPPNLCRS
jgi:hypothetical protein